MTPATFLEKLRDRGGSAIVNCGKLKMEAPPGVLTDSVRAAMKPDLIALLEAEAEAQTLHLASDNFDFASDSEADLLPPGVGIRAGVRVIVPGTGCGTVRHCHPSLDVLPAHRLRRSMFDSCGQGYQRPKSSVWRAHSEVFSSID